MDYHRLTEIIRKKNSFLCIGLDTDIKKIPAHLHHFKDPCLEFNKQIIDTTHDLCVAYKPNVAFYESRGAKGWGTLEHTVAYIRSKYPDMFLIADAKRGDIGNTSGMYARAFFEEMDFDAVTVAPYMGEDSVLPFMAYQDKWIILLALTSNKGAFDFQFHTDNKDEKLFESVIKKSQEWGSTHNLMYVVGATKAEMLRDIRKIAPKHFLLVPGVGAQGGSLEEVVKYGMNEDCGLLVNSSRGIIYADHTTQFAEKARERAQEIQQQMSAFLESL